MDQQWRCGVCNYKPANETLPEQCPVCGAKKGLFEPVATESTTSTVAASKTSTEANHGGSVAESTWQCSVCNYVHKGKHPPQNCPVCGADQTLFVLLDDEPARPKPDSDDGPTSGTPVKPAPTIAPHDFIRRRLADRYVPYYDSLAKILATYHAHPIAVHIPNGLLPIAVLFLALGILFNSASLTQAAFYNLVVVLLTMPWVMYTGYNDWQQRMGGNLTNLFRIKICCGGLILGLGTILVLWRLLVPTVANEESIARNFYFILHVGMLAAGAVAGYYGGKLVQFPGDKKIE